MNQPIEDVTVQITVPVKRYRTDKGSPTCARSFPAGEVCKFFKRFTFNENGRCSLVESMSGDWNYMAYVDLGPEGFLEPHEDCPLWRAE
jgi:hypothetical protein